MEYKHLNGNGLKIGAAIEGEGPLIVLVHGWPESWYSWRHQIPFLASLGYKVAAIDVRGYGQSDKPYEIAEYSMKNLTSDVISVIEDLGYSDAILFGHDWGAPIVWNTAALFPEKISGVGALSVPYTGRGPMSSIDLWKMLYKGKFFYQLYFQEEGVAEEEFEKDLKNALELTYFSSDGRGMSFLAENADNPEYQKNVNSKFLDCLPVFDDYPDWINKEELMFFVKEFENSGMRGPLNRYRAQTIDYEELVELETAKISQPSCFISGTLDPVAFFLKNSIQDGAGKGAFHGPTAESMTKEMLEKRSDLYEDLRIVKFIDGVGHWTQQEAPDTVNENFKKFLKGL